MPPKKEQPTGWNFDLVEATVLLLIFAGIFGLIVPALYNYFTSGQLSFFGFHLSNVVGIWEFLKSNAWFFKALGFVLAGAAAIGTFIYTQKGDAVLREEKAKVYPHTNFEKISVGVYPENMPETSSTSKPIENKQTGKWQKIVKLSESENSSDWRLAIIEADIMLDELLQNLHLPGETMGEKLKAVEQSDFTTIESAWEAHKARNNIAHEGSDFLLNDRETRRIISLYEAVFKEFFII